MSQQGFKLHGFVNPLQYLAADEPWSSVTNEEPTLESLVRFLCGPNVPSDLESLVGRYLEVSLESRRLSFVPAEPRILERLVWPLLHAKGAYVLGNYLGTIALTGMVAEMVAILFFELSEMKINDRPMSSAAERRLFGSSFEGLGQARRVDILWAYEIISEELKEKFDRIRTRRRKYLHFWSEEHQAIEKDSRDCYLAATELVVGVIGQDFADGRVLINPKLLEYLKDRGLLSMESGAEHDSANSDGNEDV